MRIFLYLVEKKFKTYLRYDIKQIFNDFPRKMYNINRTKINTDEQVENTKALERIMLKELGKLAL